MLHQGDCLEVLRTLPDNSVDSLVTDPPAGIGFMGKDWDSNKGGRDEWIAWLASVMRECHRVMKPGAHGLVWALPRTSHWTATALEDAGFEVRDVMMHLFGSGFPKSLDISKAIDKAAGAKREVVGERVSPDGVPYAARQPKEWQESGFVERKKSVPNTAVTAPATPAAKQWAGWGTALKPSVERWLLVRKPLTTVPLDSILRDVTRHIEELVCRTAPARFAERVFTSNPRASNEVLSGFAQWLADVSHTIQSADSSELMAMFSSPAEGSTFLNIVLSWNAFLDALFDLPSKSTTAIESGLTIDLTTLSFLISRSTPASTTQAVTNGSGGSSSALAAGLNLSAIEMLLLALGRHFAQEPASTPAGLYFELSSALLKRENATPREGWSDDYILIRKPLAKGYTVAQNVQEFGTGAINVDASRIPTDRSKEREYDKEASSGTTGSNKAMFAMGDNQPRSDGWLNHGRFPSHLVLSHSEHCTDDACDMFSCPVAMLDAQSGERGISKGGSRGASRFFYCAKVSSSERNAAGPNGHPTVKPQKLMRYLARLITPPGGTILDCFMGSGSTGLAAKSEGFGFVGIEREAEYFEIAKARVG